MIKALFQPGKDGFGKHTGSGDDWSVVGQPTFSLDQSDGGWVSLAKQPGFPFQLSSNDPQRNGEDALSGCNLLPASRSGIHKDHPFTKQIQCGFRPEIRPHIGEPVFCPAQLLHGNAVLFPEQPDHPQARKFAEIVERHRIGGIPVGIDPGTKEVGSRPEPQLTGRQCRQPRDLRLAEQSRNLIVFT